MLAGLAAITLEGPKGVGKTATAQRRAGTTFAMDDPTQRELIAADPQRLERAAGPVLIDEWQRYPYVWDLVRRSVDRDHSPARFLLTGSAAPTSAPTHSGAGRIVRLRMRPMSLAERAVAVPSVSLAQLLAGGRPMIGGSSEFSLPDYAEEIVKSGFPAVRTLSARARRAQLDGYLARIVEHDFPEQGHAVRRPVALRAWLAAYASATASTTSYSAILDAATPGDAEKPAKTTTIAYRDVLTQLWLLDPISGWSTSRSAFTRLAAAPKHNLADPALSAWLLGVDVDSLFSGSANHPRIHQPGPLLGAFFESLVALSVQTYAQAAEASVHHLRTRDGRREVDLIVQRGDHRVVAFQVKLTSSVNDDDVRHLNWLQWQLGDLCSTLRSSPPARRHTAGQTASLSSQPLY